MEFEYDEQKSFLNEKKHVMHIHDARLEDSAYFGSTEQGRRGERLS